MIHHALLHLRLHRFVLLLLRVVQDGFDFLSCVLMDGHHFLMAFLTRSRLVLPQLLHLLRLCLEEGLDLRLLIGGEIELLG